jgi:glycosyltransferase involved in cell wall biosynthesis
MTLSGTAAPENAEILRDGVDDGKPRFLLISGSFPPSSAVGALRWEKFAGYLDAAGIALDVVTMHTSEAESVDLQRLNALPTSTRVFGVRSSRTKVMRVLGALHTLRPTRQVGADRSVMPRLESSASAVSPIIRVSDIPILPRSAAEWRSALRGRWCREIERGWAIPAERVSRQLARRGHYSGVISSGPPNLSHVIAAKTSIGHGNLPFFMDMRDPWATSVAVATETTSAFEIAFARREERACVAATSAIIVNTAPARDLLVRAYPSAAARVHVVMNGTDDDAPPSPDAPRARFIIAFAGSIYVDRDPRLVFRAAAMVIRELSLTPDEFGFEFYGDSGIYGGRPTADIAAEEGIAPFVAMKGMIPRADLLQYLRNASMLLSLPQDIETSIPAKIFEYMSFSASLLVLATPDSATAALLRDTDADVVEPHNVEVMRDRIYARVKAFQSGQMPQPLGADGRFSRRAQAKRLLEILSAGTAAMSRTMSESA